MEVLSRQFTRTEPRHPPSRAAGIRAHRQGSRERSRRRCEPHSAQAEADQRAAPSRVGTSSDNG